MVSSMAVSAAYAHAPSAVTLSAITETTITINWTNTAAGACGVRWEESAPGCDQHFRYETLPGIASWSFLFGL